MLKQPQSARASVWKWKISFEWLVGTRDKLKLAQPAILIITTKVSNSIWVAPRKVCIIIKRECKNQTGLRKS